MTVSCGAGPSVRADAPGRIRPPQACRGAARSSCADPPPRARTRPAGAAWQRSACPWAQSPQLCAQSSLKKRRNEERSPIANGSRLSRLAVGIAQRKQTYAGGQGIAVVRLPSIGHHRCHAAPSGQRPWAPASAHEVGRGTKRPPPRGRIRFSRLDAVGWLTSSTPWRRLTPASVKRSGTNRQAPANSPQSHSRSHPPCPTPAGHRCSRSTPAPGRQFLPGH